MDSSYYLHGKRHLHFVTEHVHCLNETLHVLCKKQWCRTRHTKCTYDFSTAKCMISNKVLAKLALYLFEAPASPPSFPVAFSSAPSVTQKTSCKMSIEWRILTSEHDRQVPSTKTAVLSS